MASICDNHIKPAHKWFWHGTHDIQGGAKNGDNGISYLIANILKTPSPNSVEIIGELLQNYMLNTVICNFLFKNFIALWRHLAKTQLLSFIHIVQIELSITQ